MYFTLNSIFEDHEVMNNMIGKRCSRCVESCIRYTLSIHKSITNWKSWHWSYCGFPRCQIQYAPEYRKNETYL